MAATVDESPDVIFESHPARDLAVEPAPAVVDLYRASGQAVNVGTAGVRPGPGQCRRDEPLPDLAIGHRRRGQGLRVREVLGDDTEAVLDELDRPVQLGSDGSRVDPVEKGVGVGVGPDRDEAGRHRFGQSRPGRRPSVVGELTPALDEVGRDVEGDRHPVEVDHRYDDLGEVGRSVVEGHGHPPVQIVAGHEPPYGVIEREHATRRGEGRHLVLEAAHGEVDRDGRPGADPVVEQDDQTGAGTTHHVGGLGDDLDGLSRDSHGSRVGSSVRMLRSHAEPDRRSYGRGVSESTISVRRAGADDIPTAIALAGTALDWDPTEPNEALFRWKHLDNPAGESPMWLAYVGDSVAGFRTMMRWEFLHDHRTPIRAVRAVDTATHPDFRRRGIFRTLTMAAVEELTAERVDFVFNTPNPESRAGYLTMGWQDTGRMAVRFFPGRVKGVGRTIRARAPARKWSEPIEAGDPVDRVADELAGLSHTLGGSGLATSHTGEYLLWRYGFEPLHYRVIRTDDASAIVRLRRRGPATETVVAELFAPSRFKAEAVLRKVRREIEADHLLIAAGSNAPLPPMLPLLGLGPVLVVRSMASHAPARSELMLSLGDVELF